MLNLIELIGFGGGITPPTITFADSDTSASSATTHTYVGMTLGTAATGRVLIVCTGGNSGGSRTISSITVHVPDVAGDPTGTALAEVAVANDTTGGGSKIAAIWSGVVASGASGDVKVTYSGGIEDTGVSLFAASGIAAAADSTATDTTLTGNALSGDVTAYTDGIVIGCCWWTDAASTTWTNATEATDIDVTGDQIHSAASVVATSSATLTVTATANATPSRKALAVASWRPL